MNEIRTEGWELFVGLVDWGRVQITVHRESQMA